MVEQSRAQGGLLYACVDGVIERIATAGIAEPNEALDAWAAAYLDDQLDRDESTEVEQVGATSATTTATPTVDGAEIKSVLLMHQTAQGLAIAGVALLLVEPRGEYQPPTYLAGELSRYLVEHGDAAPLES